MERGGGGGDPAGASARLPEWLWGAALFLAAALAFSIQPLYARLLLPHLGGAPAVWIVALVFFQSALVAGYAYAHLLARIRPLSAQVAAHTVLLALAAPWLPPTVRSVPDAADPALGTFVSLATGIGVPYAALVATAPLLQSWFARGRSVGGREGGSGGGDGAYVFYAASNAGSLAGLIAYPFALEPLMDLADQSRGWMIAYALSALASVVCGVVAARGAREAHLAHRQTAGRTLGRDEGAIPPRRWVAWIGLAGLPTLWLGGASAHMTAAVAPLPLLWVLPLAAYLLSLIVAFAPPAQWRRSSRRGAVAWLASVPKRNVSRLAVASAALALAAGALEPVPLVVAAHVAGLFAGALACHRLLVALRPAPHAATGFYLAVATGGALGGAAAALAAPLLFSTLLEYPLALVLFTALGLTGNGARRASRALVAGASGRPVRLAVPFALSAASVALAALAQWGEPHPVLNPLALGVAAALACVAAPRVPLPAAVSLLAVFLGADRSPLPGSGFRTEYVRRTFFGVHRVLTSPDGATRLLLNGRISHGVQAISLGLQTQPSSYYTAEGPLGDIMRSRHASTDRAGSAERVGVIGLGAGAGACWADAQRTVTFYEIDDAVIAIARDASLFTYLARCPPEAIVSGDARVSLVRAPVAAYDLLIADAYSGGAIPVHLLTREAIALYRRAVAPNGLLVLHLSNAYFDLEPLVDALAADAGLGARIREDGTGAGRDAAERPRTPGWAPSVWAVVGPAAAVESRIGGVAGWRPLRRRSYLRPWTDTHANLLALRR